MDKFAYRYQATVKRIVDGDTLILDVDQGFKTWRHDQSFRVLGINAREHDEPGGPEARAHLETLLPAGTVVVLESVKADKYGDRYDALIDMPDGSDLSVQLVHDQWAAAWNGQGPKPVPAWPRTAV